MGEVYVSDWPSGRWSFFVPFWGMTFDRYRTGGMNMKKAFGLLGAMAICWILCVSGARAQDWPQWRGAHRDGKVTGFAAPQAWPKELAQKWKVSVGQGDATPALVGDQLCVFTRQGGDEVIQCLNAADGKELWRDQYPVPAFSGPDAGQHLGPRSSPVVADGKIVTLGTTGILSCWDAATHKLLWREDKIKEVPRFHIAMSPLVVDGMVIAHLGGQSGGMGGMGGGRMGGGRKGGNMAPPPMSDGAAKKPSGAILAFDLATGEPKWKWAGAGPDYDSPVVMNADGVKQIVTLTEKSVVGLGAADGKLLWQIPFQPVGRSYNAATPIVDGSTVIYTGANRGTHAVKIEKKGEGFTATPIWDNTELAPQFSSPVLNADGLLFGLSDKSYLFCINAKDGKTAWVDNIKRGGAYGAILDAGSVMLALPSNSELIVFKPSAAKYEELAKIKVAATPTYAHPVLAGKRIFVKDQDSLILYAID